HVSLLPSPYRPSRFINVIRRTSVRVRWLGRLRVQVRVTVLEISVQPCLPPRPRPLETPRLSRRQSIGLHPFPTRQAAPFLALPFELQLLHSVQPADAPL
ncbi:unnamed protein product, partial [Ectocarpus sp. 13 AM-2016]